MNWKRATAGLMAVGLVLSACGSDKKESSATAPAGSVDCKPVKAGVLSVVTSLPGPNFWGSTGGDTDPDKIKSGVEFDLATDIAAKCGLTMSFRNENFDTIVAGQVDPKSYDIILSQVTITDERAKVVDFSVPYYAADQAILMKAGAKITSWDDVKKLKAVGVQASTTAEYYAQGNKPGWTLSNLKSFPDLSTTYAALNAGQVDGVIIDTPINLGQAAQSSGALVVPAQFKTGDTYGAIFPKGNGKKAIFDPIIKGFVDDGTVTALVTKYFAGDPAAVPFVDVPAA
jgi:polar amino acid transport system substrate-binding protein